MSHTSRFFFIVASLLGATGVGLGAYASHGLTSWASVAQIEYFQIAVFYQLVHAIALLAATGLSLFISNRFLFASLIAYAVGISLFSGSLYLYVFSGVKILGALTPIGGLCLIIAWLLMAAAVLASKSR